MLSFLRLVRDESAIRLCLPTTHKWAYCNTKSERWLF